METSRFGEINIDENLVFTFVEPMVGFESYTKYVLIEHKENSVFKWLQSTEDPELAFPVVLPSSFQIDYEFEIPDEKAELLELTSAESLIALNVVNIPNSNPQRSTINLLAPVIINANNKLAMQLILQDDSRYDVKCPLFNEPQSKEGELV